MPRKKLPAPYDGMLAAYACALAAAPLAESSKATYLSRVRRFLAWTAEAAGGADRLADTGAAVCAARDYRRHLQDVRYAPATIDNVLAAVDDFCARRGLGVSGAVRARAQSSEASTSR
ncbi:hypothetical protein [Nonomuraea pusilla]|uniref:Phage integrase, N-terminal SAM-like domain n=1 Tax=Nonomuraea pusilla TaxID=46177 RepID=A0A1H7TPL2_9ACTN|nr:hypothetical protein [Nonomuraea pusilla]SEL86790.1 hypothetical protein SAMN05660976_03604 [Nonomuraea pusilla]